jgi:hypothetical protein
MKTLKCMFMVSLTALGACASAPPKPVAAAAPPPEKASDAVPVVAAPQLPATFTQKGVTVKIEGLWQADGKILGVNGTAKNVTATDLRFCQISLAFLDQSGAKLDDAKATTKTLKSAQVWHFQAALAHPTEAAYSSVMPDKVIAIPVKAAKPDLASLQ